MSSFLLGYLLTAASFFAHAALRPRGVRPRGGAWVCVRVGLSWPAVVAFGAARGVLGLVGRSRRSAAGASTGATPAVPLGLSEEYDALLPEGPVLTPRCGECDARFSDRARRFGAGSTVLACFCPACRAARRLRFYAAPLPSARALPSRDAARRAGPVRRPAEPHRLTLKQRQRRKSVCPISATLA